MALTKIPAGTAHPPLCGGRTAGGVLSLPTFFAQAKKVGPPRRAAPCVHEEKTTPQGHEIQCHRGRCSNLESEASRTSLPLTPTPLPVGEGLKGDACRPCARSVSCSSDHPGFGCWPTTSSRVRSQLETGKVTDFVAPHPNPSPAGRGAQRRCMPPVCAIRVLFKRPSWIWPLAEYLIAGVVSAGNWKGHGLRCPSPQPLSRWERGSKGGALPPVRDLHPVSAIAPGPGASRRDGPTPGRASPAIPPSIQAPVPPRPAAAARSPSSRS